MSEEEKAVYYKKIGILDKMGASSSSQSIQLTRHSRRDAEDTNLLVSSNEENSESEDPNSSSNSVALALATVKNLNLKF